MDEIKDNLEQRCPRLGGLVSFHYCRTNADEESVCWNIFDCWWECFDVVGFLKDYLPEERFNMLVKSKPKTKMVSIVELIEKANEKVV